MGVAGVAACTAWYIATCTACAYCRLHTTTRQWEGAKHLLVEAQPPCAPLCWRRWWRRIWRCCAGTPSPAPGKTLAQLLLAPIPWVQAHVPRRSPPPGRLGRPHRCARELGPSAGSRRDEGGHSQRTSGIWPTCLIGSRSLTSSHGKRRRLSAARVPFLAEVRVRFEYGGAPCWRAAGLAVLAFASQDRLLAAATRTAPFPNERSLGITRPNNCSRARRSRLGCRGHGDSGECSGGF